MTGLQILGGLITPLFQAVDGLTTSDKERLELKNQLFAMQTQFASTVMDYEKSVMQLQASVITAEANGSSWLQRSWRPVTMLTFLVLVVCDSFGLLITPLAEEAWTLLQLGMGGYVVGRSVERTAAQVVQAIRSKP